MASHSGAPESQASNRSLATVIAAASAGTALEWYDFFIFGALASILAKHFYDGLPEAQAFIVTLLTFAAGFIARPFGALVFGKVGDTHGRKGAFLTTIIIMGAATILIGCLPTYAQAGALAPMLLIACRLAQGFALGGEYGGAAIFVAEHSESHRRGFDTGWIQSSAAMGLILALAVVLGLRTALGEEAFSAWGWRLPFLGSVFLLIISVWIRMRLTESPVFQAMKAQGRTSQAALAETFLEWPNLRLVLLALFGLMMAQGVVFYTGYFYAQFFLERVLKVPGATVTAMMLSVSVLPAFLYVFFAWASDKAGRKPIMLAGMVLMLVAYVPGFQALSSFANPALAEAQAASPIFVEADLSECSLQLDLTGTRAFTTSCDVALSALAASALPYRRDAAPAGSIAVIRVGALTLEAPDLDNTDPEARRAAKTWFAVKLQETLAKAGYPGSADPARFNTIGVFGVLALFMVAATALYGPLAAALVELFPARIRYTALSFPYHVGTGWFGGFMPAIAFASIAATGDTYAGLWYPLAVTAAALIIALIFLPETRDKPVTGT